MRKRIFSRLMAMFMAVALLSTSALAYVEINQDFIDRADVTTETLRNQSYTYIDLKNDDYKLTENIETSHILRFKGDSENTDATLDLNGFTIDHGGAKGSVIEVIGGAKLTLEDSSGKENSEYVSAGEGKITGGKSGGVRVRNSEFVMKGGNITGNIGGNGAGVTVTEGTFTMDGGNIEDNHYYPGNNGAGGVYGAIKSTITINDGSIQKNTGTPYGPWNASAILIEDGGSLTINGGLISGNTGGDVCIGVYTGSVNPGNNTPASTAIVTGGRVIDNEGSYSMIGVNQSDVSMQWTFNGNKYIACGNGDGDHPEHTPEPVDMIPATCTSAGQEAGTRCSYCGKVLSGMEPIPATGHTYAPATCTEPGTCHCGATRGEALGHDMGEWVVTTPAQPGVAGEEIRTCSRCDYTETQPIPALPMPIDFGDGTGTGAGTGTTIDDEATPLAGIVTEAQLLDALYQHEGSPEVELVEKYASHEYAPAISWALANGIEVDDEDFDPDEAVTVALLREVLVNFVEYKGIEFTVTVDGEDEDLVMDLSERLNVFFAELEK